MFFSTDDFLPAFIYICAHIHTERFRYTQIPMHNFENNNEMIGVIWSDMLTTTQYQWSTFLVTLVTTFGDFFAVSGLGETTFCFSRWALKIARDLRWRPDRRTGWSNDDRDEDRLMDGLRENAKAPLDGFHIGFGRLSKNLLKSPRSGTTGVHSILEDKRRASLKCSCDPVAPVPVLPFAGKISYPDFPNSTKNHSLSTTLYIGHIYRPPVIAPIAKSVSPGKNDCLRTVCKYLQFS